MNDIRRRLEALISDSGMFRAGQQEERLRLCHLIDMRIDTLRTIGNPTHVRARCEELLRIRQALSDHQ